MYLVLHLSELSKGKQNDGNSLYKDSEYNYINYETYNEVKNILKNSY